MPPFDFAAGAQRLRRPRQRKLRHCRWRSALVGKTSACAKLLQEDAQIRVLRCTFPPGVGHEMHYHPPHFGYVLEGNSVMRITTAAGVVDRPVRAGTSFSNEAEIQHAALNVGEETTRYLIIEKKYADARPADAVAPGLCRN